MTTTLTQTFNRDDIRRVYASFGADYRLVAEYTGLRTKAEIDRTTEQVKALALEQYLSAVHLHLVSAAGAIRQAAVYRVSTDASGWSSDRPGDLYWVKTTGDYLRVIVFFSRVWWDLTQAERDAFEAEHLPGWGTTSFDGQYPALMASVDRHYASAGYGIQRTWYSG